ncbi:MAG TPA: helix-turn-helix domain-containing protein [Actinomycetota bacterium]|nr:helix-turn-helix domain-containing protein [Actinomycetota bacterium]
MHRTSFADMACSVARTLDVVGEWWTPLILRDAFLGTTRFDEFQRSLGIARNVLTARLQGLVEQGIFEKVRYHEHPERFGYHLTEAGRELFPIISSLIAWGDRWRAGEHGPPLLLVHAPCGHAMAATPTCSECGEVVRLEDIRPQPGPGAV